MTPLEAFNLCNSGAYAQTKSKVSWKIDKGIMCFEPSKGKEDWIKNFLVFPVPTKIGKQWMIIPLGFYLAWREVREIVANANVDGFIGYSHGAVLASLSSCARFGLNTAAFGCPRFLLFPTKKVMARFWGVTFYKNPGDIVTKVPPIYSSPREIKVLTNKAFIPIGFDLVQWMTGHTPEEYWQRLTGVE